MVPVVNDKSALDDKDCIIKRYDWPVTGYASRSLHLPHRAVRFGWRVTQNPFLRPRRGLETFRSVVEGFDSGTYKSCFNDLSLSPSRSNFPHVN